MKKVLAIDMGATSIRGILGYVEDGKIVMEEVMRFSHKITTKDGRMRWQWEEMLTIIKETIGKYKDEITSVGIDTWGVDFGIIDKDGDLIETPISYRDPKNALGYEEALKELTEKEIFTKTGTQIMNINTLFQLLALKKVNKEHFDKIDKILMMPDLIQYFLTGEMVGEETIWSTSQILNLKERNYDERMVDLVGLPKSAYPRLVRAGEVTGKIHNENIDVVSVCGHDTASAVLLTGAMRDEKCMFLSCGTWSLFGARVPEANLSEEMYDANLTNELGFNSTNLLFQNITGLYLLEKYKQGLEAKKGARVSFDEITAYVTESFKRNPEPESILDMDDPRFAKEGMDAKAEIDSFLIEKGLSIPENELDYFRIIYDSLVSKYVETREKVEKITGVKYERIHMIGGGAKSSLLCQRISDRMGLEITAGPFEASALGNILIQLHTAGEFESIEQAVEASLKTVETKLYKPN